MNASIKRDIDQIIEANEYLKEQVRVMKEIIDGRNGAMPKHCKSCKHFEQHYVKGSCYIGGYSEIDFGHCKMSGKGIKSRDRKHATDQVCEFYEMG